MFWSWSCPCRQAGDELLRLCWDGVTAGVESGFGAAPFWIEVRGYSITKPKRLAMKAVRIHEYGGPEQLRFEEDVPEPQVTADTVLIEAAAASVNPIDWKVRSGARQKDFPHDASGDIRQRRERYRAYGGFQCTQLQSRRSSGSVLDCDVCAVSWQSRAHW